MDLSIHENIIYLPLKKIVFICGYDNGYDIPDEILDLAFYIRDKFNTRKIGYLKESRDEIWINSSA